MKKKVKLFLLLTVITSISCSNMIADFSDAGMPRAVPKNAVGATDSMTLRSLGYTPTDANSIFVAKTGNDDTGTGTQANPVASINKAITICDADHQKVVILDSETYTENSFEFMMF